MLSIKLEQCERGLIRRQGAVAVALPTLQKCAKICHNEAEDRPIIGQNFVNNGSFFRATPLNLFPLRIWASQITATRSPTCLLQIFLTKQDAMCLCKSRNNM